MDFFIIAHVFHVTIEFLNDFGHPLKTRLITVQGFHSRLQNGILFQWRSFQHSIHKFLHFAIFQNNFNLSRI